VIVCIKLETVSERQSVTQQLKHPTDHSNGNFVSLPVTPSSINLKICHTTNQAIRQSVIQSTTQLIHIHLSVGRSVGQSVGRSSVSESLALSPNHLRHNRINERRDGQSSRCCSPYMPFKVRLAATGDKSPEFVTIAR
jgi:hypothetical protein